MRVVFTALFLLAVAGTCRMSADTFDVFGGSAYNFRTPVTVYQPGATAMVTANWKTKGTGGAYMAWRFSFWSGNHAIEFEHIHHKLTLMNPPDSLEHMEISHGYNMFFVNYAWRDGGMVYRTGAGIVVAHPESVVGGVKWPESGGIFNTGYYFAGFAGQLAVEERLKVSDDFSLAAEGAFTAADARVPIPGGSAHVPNIALHGLLGVSIGQQNDE